MEFTVEICLFYEKSTLQLRSKSYVCHLAYSYLNKTGGALHTEIQSGGYDVLGRRK